MKTTRTHMGNPSYESVLEIPLIVSPAYFPDPTRFVRTQDLYGMIAELAGVPEARPAGRHVLDDDELFLTERAFLTYRRGRYKSMFHRRQMRRWALFDLEADPGETVNLMSSEREVGVAHLERAQQLADQLSSSAPRDETFTQEDRARLRALGYLEEAEPASE